MRQADVWPERCPGDLLRTGAAAEAPGRDRWPPGRTPAADRRGRGRGQGGARRRVNGRSAPGAGPGPCRSLGVTHQGSTQSRPARASGSAPAPPVPAPFPQSPAPAVLGRGARGAARSPPPSSANSRLAFRVPFLCGLPARESSNALSSFRPQPPPTCGGTHQGAQPRCIIDEGGLPCQPSALCPDPAQAS